jgi:hypothetical protein
MPPRMVHCLPSGAGIPLASFLLGNDAGVLHSLCMFKVEGTRAPACCPDTATGGGKACMGHSLVCIHWQMSLECVMGPHH